MGMRGTRAIGWVKDQILLDMLRVADSRLVPRTTMETTWSIEEVLSQTADELRVALEGWVLADHLAADILTETVHYEEWASWWQHTKAVHFPTFSRWLRRPPRTVPRGIEVRIHYRQTAGYPQAKIRIPLDDDRLGRPFFYETYETEWSHP